MIVGLLSLFSANAAAVQGARALLGRVRTGDPALDAVLFLLLRLLLVSAAVLAAGLAGLLSAGALGLAGLAALAVLSRIPGEHRAAPRMRLGGVPPLLVAAIGILALRFLLQTWFLAPFDGDAVGYHLPKIAEWIRAGGFTRALGTDPLSSLPAGFELVETWWVVFFRHDVLIELAGVEFAALGACATWALARRAGLPETAAPWAGVLFAATPGILLQATACVNDAPVASLLLAAFAFAASPVDLALLALPVFLGAGMKGTAVFALPGVALLAYLERRGRGPARPGLPAVALGAVALAVGSFWYLRNLAWFGNPVHPVSAAGYEYAFVSIQAGPRPASLLSNLDRYFGFYLADRDNAYGSSLRQVGGWGAAGFAFGLIALLGACREDRRWRAWTASFALSLACVFLCVATDGYFGRFVLFTAGLIATALVHLGARSRPLAAAIGIAATLQFVLTLVPGNLGGPRAAALARQPVALRSMAGVYGLPDLGPRVGLWTHERTIEYSLYGPDYSREVFPLRLDDPWRLPAELRRLGLESVFVHLRGSWGAYELGVMSERGELRRIGDRCFRLP